MRGKKPQEYLPLSSTDFQLLLALADGDLHGYAIGKAVREASGGRVRIGLGSLYRIIARLSRDGIVEDCTGPEEQPGGGKKRRRYRLTALGLDVLREEVNRLDDAVKFARSSQLFSDGQV